MPWCSTGPSCTPSSKCYCLCYFSALHSSTNLTRFRSFFPYIRIHNNYSYGSCQINIVAENNNNINRLLRALCGRALIDIEMVKYNRTRGRFIEVSQHVYSLLQIVIHPPSSCASSEGLVYTLFLLSSANTAS